MIVNWWSFLWFIVLGSIVFSDNLFASKHKITPSEIFSNKSILSSFIGIREPTILSSLRTNEIYFAKALISPSTNECLVPSADFSWVFNKETFALDLILSFNFEPQTLLVSAASKIVQNSSKSITPSLFVSYSDKISLILKFGCGDWHALKTAPNWSIFNL